MAYFPQHCQELWPLVWPGAVGRSSCVEQEAGEGAALSRGAGEVLGQLGASMGLAGTKSCDGMGTARPEFLVVLFPSWGLEWLCSERGLQRCSAAFLFLLSERWTGIEHLGAHKQPRNNKPTGSQGWHLPLACWLGSRKLTRGRSFSIACLPCAALRKTIGKRVSGARSRQRHTMHFGCKHTDRLFLHLLPAVEVHVHGCTHRYPACTWLR